MGNTFGKLFRITTWGESHGPALGVIIDGCPAGFKLNVKQLQKELDRRKPGQSKVVSERKESDKVEILSGVFEGITTGTPISLMIRNTDQKSSDYQVSKDKYRPSHADFTYEAKYGQVDPRGGGRASARETVGRVTAGALAKQILSKTLKLNILAYVKQVHEIQSDIDPQTVTTSQIERDLVRCPDAKAAKKMAVLIKKMKEEGDTVGGIIECVIRNVPAGLGSPVFEKLEARLAQAMLSIPSTRGFEIGSGFKAVFMKGSEHNDSLMKKKGKIITSTNHAGGIVGGVTNGMDIVFRVAFKAPSSIMKLQKTVTKKGQSTYLEMTGRHDPCVLPRAVPIVEAMAALVLVDEWLIQKTVKMNLNQYTPSS